MEIIQLTRGVVALVDEDDYAGLALFGWHALLWRGRYYAGRHEPGTRKTILMHRQIIGALRGERVDHRKHYPLDMRLIDNRRSNLRIATERQNQQNCRKHARRDGTSHSVFKGVTLHRRNGKWKGQIKIEGHQTALGYFQNEGHAALAYDLAAVKHFGEFALTNFPVPGSTNWIYGG